MIGTGPRRVASTDHQAPVVVAIVYGYYVVAAIWGGTWAIFLGLYLWLEHRGALPL